MTTHSRRDFLRSSSVATVLAGVPAWGLFSAAAALAQPRVDEQGTLTVALHPEPPTLATFFNTAGTSVVVSAKTLEGLLEYDHDLTPRPQLASSWTVSPDGLQYDFILRQGVRWHDGEPFSATDAAFSLRLASRYHPRGAVTFANLVAVDAVDAHTLRVTLSKPAPYLLLALSAGETPMLPAHRYDLDTALQNPLNAAPIGTGPFRFKEWQRGSHILYERNPDYWQPGKPGVGALLFRLIPDIAARLTGFQNRSIDLGESSPVPPSEIPKLPDFLATTTEGYEDNATMIMLEFNLERAEFQKLAVRQAIAHALDREQIRRVAFYGYALPAVSPVSQASFPRLHLDAANPYPTDINRANQLLDEAGYPRRGSQPRFAITIHANPFNQGGQRTAHYVRSALARLGIQVTVREQDPGSYIRSVYTEREFDCTISSVSTMFDPTVGLQRVFWSKSFNPQVPWSNASHYHNPEVDQLLEAAAVEPDPARRAELFKQFQAIVIREIPSIALVQAQSVTVYNKRVAGFNGTAAGVRGNLADVHFTDA